MILFAPNIGTPEETRSAVAELQRASAASVVHAPLLIMTDQEGGLVRRLPGAPELSEKQIGASPDAQCSCRRIGAGSGLNLAGVGINVNLAPVLDVFRQPGDFIDSYQRSYGMNPGLVAELGGAFITAQQQTGVAATAKHFPGLGAAGASQNTDEAPVELDVPLSELRTVDELPYETAIAADVRLVMTSWATYPALDPRFPAGLSPNVIEGELRGRLGFRGVTITDGIGAGALAGYGDVAQRGLLAARAGADLILCSAHEVVENSPAEGADGPQRDHQSTSRPAHSTDQAPKPQPTVCSRYVRTHDSAALKATSQHHAGVSNELCDMLWLTIRAQPGPRPAGLLLARGDGEYRLGCEHARVCVDREHIRKTGLVKTLTQLAVLAVCLIAKHRCPRNIPATSLLYQPHPEFGLRLKLDLLGDLGWSIGGA